MTDKKQETDSEAEDNKPKKKKIKTTTLIQIITVLLVLLVAVISKYLYQIKTEDFKNEVYKNLVDKKLAHFELFKDEKLNTSLLIASSLSKSLKIKEALEQNNPDLMDFNQLLFEMRAVKEYQHIEAYLINKDGICLKRSWSEEKGDDLVRYNPEFGYYLKYPTVLSSVEANEYGLFFTNKIPIYKDSKFLGYFVTLTNLDTLSSIFDVDNFHVVVLLNKKHSRSINQDLSYSKKFVGDYYVANKNANNYYIKYIKEQYVDEFYKKDFDEGFFVDKKISLLIFKYDIVDKDKNVIAKAFIFKDLDSINYKNLESIQKFHIIITVVIEFLLIAFMSYLYVKNRMKELEVENSELIVENKEMQDRTKEMEFTEKKMLNLFDAQPNIMVMHNGKEVVKGNQRFLGFFNRFGSFEGFKQRHLCISELFEEFHAKDYIYTQYIEDIDGTKYYWIDYLLKYPRKPYKTVMSINGDPHHFYIKFNEMEYAKYSDNNERLIFIAFVDFTADLKNYEDCYKFQKEVLEIKEKQENINKNGEKKEVKVKVGVKRVVEK